MSELELSKELKATEKILEVCKLLDADVYLSGPFGRHYLDEQQFIDVKLKYHEFISPVYTQLGDVFIPNLSALDYTLNCGGKIWK